MSFLNSKEDVLDIQLTPYGKFLYSQGKLKPSYYAFFDDDILYDGQYASLSESQNNIEPRIQEETPYIMCLANTNGIETNLRTPYQLGNSNSTNELYSFTKLLGTSDLDYNYGSSWDIKFIKGNINSFESVLTSSNRSINIPQINTSVVYETSINKASSTTSTLGRVPITFEDYQNLSSLGENTEPYTLEGIIEQKRQNNNYNNFDLSGRFEDGTAILVEEKSIILDIDELNTQLTNDAFEVEVFRYDKDSSGNDVLTKLFFKHKKPSIVNNILIDDESTNDIEITKEFVEYYFNVLVDNEISNQTICDFIAPTQKGKNTMINIVGCDETNSKPTTNNIYQTNAKAGETC